MPTLSGLAIAADRRAPRTVTVAVDRCIEAGMLTTIAMLQGSDAIEFLEAQGVRFWCE